MGGGDAFKDDDESSSSSSSYPTYCLSDELVIYKENIPKIVSNHEVDLINRQKTYQKILQSYDLSHDKLKRTKRNLKLSRRQILRYTPGPWSGNDLSNFDIPKRTSIIIVGPKGAGKSILVNRITSVIEDDEVAPPRAQESYGSPSEGGTFFVQEYATPRGASASFCLYDTRGLSQTSSYDNTRKIEQWITEGVHHGEPVIWASDSSDLRDRLIQDGCTDSEIKKVNSVIFVVNAVEILKSIETETNYAHMVSAAFSCPSLSFKDDKPALVMTHGDILLPEERARVRVFLGELLSIPPDKQIFDISESKDAATDLTVCNLIQHSLEHADKNLRNLPKKKFTTVSKAKGSLINRISVDVLLNALILFLALAIIWFVHADQGHGHTTAHEDHHKLHTTASHPSYNATRLFAKRVLLRSLPQSDSEPAIDWRATRGLWFDEEKVAEAETERSLNWRATRRLWYAE